MLGWPTPNSMGPSFVHSGLQYADNTSHQWLLLLLLLLLLSLTNDHWDFSAGNATMGHPYAQHLGLAAQLCPAIVDCAR